MSEEKNLQSPSMAMTRIAASLACVGVALPFAFLGGCNRDLFVSPPGRLPTGSFRVTVKNLVTADPSVVVTQVGIEKEGDVAVQVKGSTFDYGPHAGSAAQAANGLNRAETLIVADLITNKNKANNTFKLLLHSTGTVTSGGFSTTVPAPTAKKASDVFTVTIQPGTYPLKKSLLLATFQGKPITLSVR